MKPDLKATKFSPQNAYYFARLSRMAYKMKNEVEGLLVGNATSTGLGFDRFHWFEVKHVHSHDLCPCLGVDVEVEVGRRASSRVFARVFSADLLHARFLRTRKHQEYLVYISKMEKTPRGGFLSASYEYQQQ